MQKLQLWWRGSRRRREEQDREFLTRNAGWGVGGGVPSPAVPERSAPDRVDLEGLQAAYLDQSGRIDYYLDARSGEVVEVRDGGAPPAGLRRVPRRDESADAEDRAAFAAGLPAPQRNRMAAAATPAEFRRALAEDRALERAWYLFRNDRATAAIARWLTGS